ncbi:MAG: type II toxin-antitoxin system HicA family toxin [Cyclobacteriaceae bacterium]|nr:type II toxin-antitoxin system HicA family toxin [Cyclobacteriaceae bacterium]
MKLPRNISARELIKSLGKIGYEVTRQKGSHIRLSCNFPSEYRVQYQIMTPSKSAVIPFSLYLVTLKSVFSPLYNFKSV